MARAVQYVAVVEPFPSVQEVETLGTAGASSASQAVQSTVSPISDSGHPENSERRHDPRLGRRCVGDVVTLNSCVVGSVDSKNDHTTLRSLHKANGLAELPATVVRLVAIRDTFHGDRTYAPGETFEAVSEIAARLERDSLVVPEREYELRRLVRVKAIENFEYEGRDRAPGTVFDASYRDAIGLVQSRQARMMAANTMEVHSDSATDRRIAVETITENVIAPKSSGKRAGRKRIQFVGVEKRISDLLDSGRFRGKPAELAKEAKAFDKDGEPDLDLVRRILDRKRSRKRDRKKSNDGP